ncbi:hypothetical protein [Joostella sp. CR20]|uniref:hypothetical protein n=1 Tax=Joostella sp. CR20 TaxID=2804312 RepID=UPI00313D3F15
MKKLKATKVTFQKGKEIKSELIGEKKVMDSIADNLVTDSKHAIEEAEKSKDGKIITFTAYEEVEEVKESETELNTLRVKYEELFGEKPHHATKAETLIKKIEEAEKA